MPRLLLASLLLGSSTVAFAQAPGDTAPAPMAPVADPCGSTCVTTRVPVMANRFAVGLSVGAFGVAPESNPDAQTNFNIGELALRYRATRHLELQLALSGGRQVTEDGEDGDLAAGMVSLGVRYRFMPEHRWNWFLSGAIGATTIARHDAGQDEQKASQRPMGSLGIGVERRFRHFAVEAELRAIGLGPLDEERATDVMNAAAPAATPPAMSAPEKLSGGTFTIGGSYYF